MMLPVLRVLCCCMLIGLVPVSEIPAADSTASTAIRVIIMADDLGAAEAVNTATFAAARDGVVTTSNIIVPGPWFPQVVRLAKDNPNLDIGIHLAMTSEWSDIKWRPLTGGRSFCDPDGYFPPAVWPKPTAPASSSLRGLTVDFDEVEKELRAQIELAKRHVPRVSYLWPHMGFTSHSPEMLAVVRKLAAEYDIPLFNDVMNDLNISRLKTGYDKYDSGDKKAAALVTAIEKLIPGTYVMVDHAANDTPEMQAIGHPGYERVAADRSANTSMWMNPTVKAAIKNKGATLISAALVAEEWRQTTRKK